MMQATYEVGAAVTVYVYGSNLGRGKGDDWAAVEGPLTGKVAKTMHLPLAGDEPLDYFLVALDEPLVRRMESKDRTRFRTTTEIWAYTNALGTAEPS